MSKKVVVVTIVDGTDEDILDFREGFIAGFTLRRIVGDKFYLIFNKG